MIFTIAAKNSVASKGRTALSLITIVLSVAFVAGTLILTDTANSTFDRLFQATASDITVSAARSDTNTKPIQTDAGRPQTITSKLVPRIAAQPGIATALGEISVRNVTIVNPGTNKAIGPTEGSLSIAGNWYTRPNSALQITDGKAPHGPRQALLDADTANRAKLEVGAPLRVITATGTHNVTVSGIATFTTTNPGAGLVLFDTPTAQKHLLGRTGVFTSIVAYADGSRTNEQLKSQIAAELANAYEVHTAAESVAQNKAGFGGYLQFLKYAMLGFAGISFLVGGFLIVNTYLMLVAERTREIGLLRAIGTRRIQITQCILAEALILGIVGSVLGLVVGLLLALALIKYIGVLGINLAATSLTLDWTAPLAALSLGIATTLAAAWLPARRASGTSPMGALRTAETPEGGLPGWIRAGAGTVTTVSGGILLIVSVKTPALRTGATLIALGIPLTLAGTVILGPLLATILIRTLGSSLSVFFGPPGKLAQRNTLSNPCRTGTTAAALTTSLALVTSASLITSSMVTSAISQIDQAIGADYLVTAQTGSLTPAILKAVRSTPGLSHISEERQLSATITTVDGKASPQRIDVVSLNYYRNIRVRASAGDFKTALSNGISISHDFAVAHRLQIGDYVRIALGEASPRPLRIQAITTEDNDLYAGRTYIGQATAARLLPAGRIPLSYQLLAMAAEHEETNKTYSSLKKSVANFPNVRVLNQSDYKELIKRQISQLLYIIYGLLGLSVTIGALGLMNTLTLSVTERTREIGLLRAVGCSRGQVMRMIQVESLVIALLGAALGGMLGCAWGIAGQQVLKEQGLQHLTVPIGTITTMFLGTGFIGLITALAPAFRASRMDVLAAITGRP
ncbi:ABC transporter permease [Streptomyces lavendulocolor]|uniref:ABC transporter permease n=1 Tax=Streptomyces lavendulocolor TaxID=67316 RepID=UPI0033C5A3AF